jgi:predicted oxidoreductase
VSNQTPNRILLLQKYLNPLNIPIVTNQLQLSITNSTLISQEIHMNMLDDTAVSRDNGVLDFCRLQDITIQAWSPFQYGFFEGVFLGSPKYPELNKVLLNLAVKYSSTPTALALAWLLRHPAKFQPVIGTMNTARLKECVSAAEVKLTREDWYAIWRSAGNVLP